jgi:hypothetical protein
MAGWAEFSVCVDFRTRAGAAIAARPASIGISQTSRAS